MKTEHIILGAAAVAVGYAALSKKSEAAPAVGKLKSGRFVIDKPALKNVSVANLNYEGKNCGKVLSTYSNSGTVTTGIWVWDGPLKAISTDKNVDTAGGYGYDKLSQNIYTILKGNGIEPKVVSPGNGRTRAEFELWGYEYTELV